MKQITINNITIDLEKKRIKNMYLKVQVPDGRVHISAPMRMSEDDISRFVLTKLDWIELQQEKIRQRYTQEEQNYSSGEEIYAWGQKFLLTVVEEARRTKIIPDGDRLYLYVKEGSTPEQRKRIINAWYKEILLDNIPPFIAKWEKIIGVKSTGFSIRDMKSRWGTCNIRSKKICLSLQLAKKHPRCLEYVVVHELVHLLEKSHNSVFKAYLDKFLPDWRNRKKEMNTRTGS